jgi:hypothetical protein
VTLRCLSITEGDALVYRLQGQLEEVRTRIKSIRETAQETQSRVSARTPQRMPNGLHDAVVWVFPQ